MNEVLFKHKMADFFNTLYSRYTLSIESVIDKEFIPWTEWDSVLEKIVFIEEYFKPLNLDLNQKVNLFEELRRSFKFNMKKTKEYTLAYEESLKANELQYSNTLYGMLGELMRYATIEGEALKKQIEETSIGAIKIQFDN